MVRWGRWQGPRAPTPQASEQVVVARIDPAQVEIHCHGGTAVIEMLLADLKQAGALEQSWQHSLGENQSDRLCRAALVALTEAPTERTAMHLLAQANGALSRAVMEIIEGLTANDAASDWPLAIDQIEVLLSRGSLGSHLTRPWQVVLAGLPNAGKSSLLNALLGYERALVYDQPGTTRDVVAATTAIGGWPVAFSDTAGVRSSADPLESQGIRLASAELARADLVLLVFDGSVPWSAAAQELADRWPRALWVLNKSDLPYPVELPRDADAQVSALTGSGVPELLELVSLRLVPAVPLVEAPIPFMEHQVQALQAAQAWLQGKDVARAAGVLQELVRGSVDSAPAGGQARQ